MTPAGVNLTDRGQWNSDSLPDRVSFGTTHPDPPLVYTFTITDTSGTPITATATVDCFVESFATNLSAAKNAQGDLVFSWTKIPGQKEFIY